MPLAMSCAVRCLPTRLSPSPALQHKAAARPVACPQCRPAANHSWPKARVVVAISGKALNCRRSPQLWPAGLSPRTRAQPDCYRSRPLAPGRSTRAQTNASPLASSVREEAEGPTTATTAVVPGDEGEISSNSSVSSSSSSSSGSSNSISSTSSSSNSTAATTTTSVTATDTTGTATNTPPTTTAGTATNTTVTATSTPSTTITTAATATTTPATTTNLTTSLHSTSTPESTSSTTTTTSSSSNSASSSSNGSSSSSIASIMGPKGVEQFWISRETVIRTPKHRIMDMLAERMGSETERADFHLLCDRLESTFRSIYQKQFSLLTRCYCYFDPVDGPNRLAKEGLGEDDIQAMEIEFLSTLFALLEKSNFKLLSDDEYKVATSSSYRLSFPITVDESRIDKSLLMRFFQTRPNLAKDLPTYGSQVQGPQYLIFRQGIGVDQFTDFFYFEKRDLIISRLWKAIVWFSSLEHPKRVQAVQALVEDVGHMLTKWLPQQQHQQQQGNDGAADEKGQRFRHRKVREHRNQLQQQQQQQQQQENGAKAAIAEEGIVKSDSGSDGEDGGSRRRGIVYERIRIENMPLSLSFLLRRTTIQEPTFQRIIVVYRPAPPPASGRRAALTALAADTVGEALQDLPVHHQSSIIIRQFDNIPMADLEITLPEKKTPGLTPNDWLQMGTTASGGLAAVTAAVQVEDVSLTLVIGILAAMWGYITRILFSWSAAMLRYNNIITAAVYSKQTDSGRGTLLTLCDSVMEQEVKEAVLAYYMLITQGKATELELDERCEHLLEREFDETVDFDVADASSKLLRLGIVSQDSEGHFIPVPIKEAISVIGRTTDELVEDVIGVEEEVIARV